MGKEELYPTLKREGEIAQKNGSESAKQRQKKLLTKRGKRIKMF